MKQRIAILLFCMSCGLMSAQDIHWSQPSNAMLYYNPAFAGINGIYNAGINYRNQWLAAGKAYKTYMASGDLHFNDNGSTQFALGALVSNDVSGDGRYKTLTAQLSTACLLKVNSKNFFGVGLGFGYVQNSLSDEVFSWGNQFNGEVYDPGMSSGEAQGAMSHRYFDLSAGVSYKFDANQGAAYTNRGRWIVGFAVGHLTQPNISFTGKDKLPMKQTAYLKGSLPMGEKFALMPLAAVLLQGNSMEVTGGLLLHRNIGQVSKLTSNRKGAAASLGLLYRTNTAIIPTIELEKGSSIFAISYDINFFGFSTATRRGGLEFSIRLRSTRSAPPATKHHGRPKHGGKWF